MMDALIAQQTLDMIVKGLQALVFQLVVTELKIGTKLVMT